MSRYSISPIALADLLTSSGTAGEIFGNGAVEVTGITQDSRSVISGDLFCCVVGESFDGHAFVNQAVSSGATAILVEIFQTSLPEHVAQIVVPSVRDALGFIASAAFGHPSRQLVMVGVTGTNGKTSTSAIIGSMFSANGFKTKVLGTLTNERTTPEAIDLQHELHELLNSGITHIVMEVSSHGLAHGRVNGIVFNASVFTNLGHDHLDFHGTYENYFAAKARLFTPQLSQSAVVNADDKYGQLLLDVCEIPSVGYSLSELSEINVTANAVSFRWNAILIHVPLGGTFALLNTLAAISVARKLGISDSSIVHGCSQVSEVPGRFQSVPNDLGVGVIVDFAHTPEGLEGLLVSVRALTERSLIVVFGCGGNRDAAKRPVMGKIASNFADVVYVTSDNPRNEVPQKIINEILHGCDSSISQVKDVVDRSEAIESAIIDARPGDIVVIAGKGHEATQEIMGVFSPFSDVEVAQKVLRIKMGSES